ncbi:hypothetical protein XENORESO_013947 [Xenotaenia resolanae]|uniref:Ig-like domain-containing protein n=1 Tax=Xenotaenia resolanae TaxID=208358 RepID=A0ABV0WMT8_9TELE
MAHLNLNAGNHSSVHVMCLLLKLEFKTRMYIFCFQTDPLFTKGDRRNLSSGVPSVECCASTNWTVSFMALHVSVVTAGRVTSSNNSRYHLLKDCSLEITGLDHSDARMYSCKSGLLKSSVSLWILESK